MRMTEFPVLGEIKDEYTELRYAGNTRAEAVQKLMESYRCELEYGAEDDGLLFWIGLADAQHFHKELTEDVAAEAGKALDIISGYDWEISQSDIDRRKSKYQDAPMPEKKFGKPRPKFRCEWKIGDTYAYQMTSEEAKELGIQGKYVLFRKVSENDFDGKIVPIVTLTLWNREPFPPSAEDFSSAPLLKLERGGRMFSREDHFEYRTELLFKNKRQLNSLVFVGNFTNVPMPDDEIIFTRAGVILLTLPENIEKECCRYWRKHLYCQKMLNQ